jgi:hypothetical protein
MQVATKDRLETLLEPVNCACAQEVNGGDVMNREVEKSE